MNEKFNQPVVPNTETETRKVSEYETSWTKEGAKYRETKKGLDHAADHLGEVEKFPTAAGQGLARFNESIDVVFELIQELVDYRKRKGDAPDLAAIDTLDELLDSVQSKRDEVEPILDEHHVDETIRSKYTTSKMKVKRDDFRTQLGLEPKHNI